MVKIKGVPIFWLNVADFFSADYMCNSFYWKGSEVKGEDVKQMSEKDIIRHMQRTMAYIRLLISEELLRRSIWW